MSRTISLAGIVFAILASPATAGDWRAHATETPPWHHQERWIGTGPEAYYSQHPDHIPAYPTPLVGYAVPIFPTSRPVVQASPAYGSHEAWCAERYRSYDWRSDTWQPYHVPRQVCRSPWG